MSHREEVLRRSDERVDNLLDRITGRIQTTLRDLRTRRPAPGLESEFEPVAEEILDEALHENAERSR